jgi:hypothetical protein
MVSEHITASAGMSGTEKKCRKNPEMNLLNNIFTPKAEAENRRE